MICEKMFAINKQITAIFILREIKKNRFKFLIFQQFKPVQKKF